MFKEAQRRAREEAVQGAAAGAPRQAGRGGPQEEQEPGEAATAAQPGGLQVLRGAAAEAQGGGEAGGEGRPGEEGGPGEEGCAEGGDAGGAEPAQEVGEGGLGEEGGAEQG